MVVWNMVENRGKDNKKGKKTKSSYSIGQIWVQDSGRQQGLVRVFGGVRNPRLGTDNSTRELLEEQHPSHMSFCSSSQDIYHFGFEKIIKIHMHCYISTSRFSIKY